MAENNLYIYPEWISPLDHNPSRESVASTVERRWGLRQIFKIAQCAISILTSQRDFSGTADVYSNNTCITEETEPYKFECGADKVRPNTHDNAFYTKLGPGGTLFTCGSDIVNGSMKEWQKLQNPDGTPCDARSFVGLLPTDDELLERARKLIF